MRDQDHHARDDAATLMTAGLLARRPDVSPEMFTRYWRDVHGPLAARIRGFHQYWQHHLGAPAQDLWPVPGVDQSVPEAHRIEGFAETTFRVAADRERLGRDPAAQALFGDERNVFRATYLCPSAPGQSCTLLDRFADPAPQGDRPAPCWIMLLHRADGVDQPAFAAFLRDRVAPALAAAPEAVKVRLHLLQPYDAAAWNTPDVRHDLPPAAQHHAMLELAFQGEDALRDAVGRLADELPGLVGAMHTYPVTATYTMVQDGRPTLVGLKGLSVAETILATAARNQASPEILRLLHGPDVPVPADGPATHPVTQHEPPALGLATARADHLMLGVDDLDHVTAWYRDTLGFAVEKTWTVDGLPGIRLAYLVGPGGFRMELIAGGHGPRTPDPASFDEHFRMRGYQHVCYRVDDVDATMTELDRRGVAAFVPATDYPKGAERRVAFVKDPEGNVVEFAGPLLRRG